MILLVVIVKDLGDIVIILVQAVLREEDGCGILPFLVVAITPSLLSYLLSCISCVCVRHLGAISLRLS